MLQRLLGLDMLKDNYDPFAGLERVNPLLKRESKITRVDLPEQPLPIYNLQWQRSITIVHLLTIFVMLCGSLGNVGLFFLFAVLPSLAISVGTDIYTNIRTVFRWHAASQRETWDVQRLALRDDRELIRTYETVETLDSWKAYQLDMTMRVAPATIMAGSGGALIAGVPISILFSVHVGIVQLIELVVLGVFLIRMAMVYISDPRWRFRANVLWSLLCATQFRETATASMAAVAGSLGVRLLHLIGLVAVLVLAYGVMQDQRMFIVQPDALLLLRWFAVFAVLSFELLPVTRWLYNRLYQWLERRVLVAISNGAL